MNKEILYATALLHKLYAAKVISRKVFELAALKCREKLS